MKRIIESTSNEGLEALLGEKVTLFCTRYIYYGTLTGLNDNFCLITDPYIVYETGDWSKEGWSLCSRGRNWRPKDHAALSSRS